MPETATPVRMQERPPGALFRALVSVAVEPGLAHDASEEVRDRAGENILAAVQASEERLRNQTEARFGQIDTRFGQINARFSQMDARFSQMDARFDVLTEMIQSTQREIQSTQREIQSTQREIQSTQREISTLRWMIGIGFTLLALFIALAKLIGD